ncbi:MAG: FG-GAP-like repeat-containing protein, partial [Thermoplasmata archaeon]
MKVQTRSIHFAMLAITCLLLSVVIQNHELYSDTQITENVKKIEECKKESNEEINEIHRNDIRMDRMGTPAGYGSIERRLGHGTDIGLYDSLFVKNVDDDMEKEIIFGNAQGYVHVLEYNGEDTIDQWISDKKDKNTHSVAVDDVDKDGRMDIVFTTNTGLVHIYEWNGTSFAWRWSSTSLGSGTSVNPFKTVIDDTNSDGINEIIVGLKDGRIIAFDGSNPSSAQGGPNSWTITKGQMPYGILVTDCEYDGKKEIIVGFDAGDVYIFDGSDKSVCVYSDRLGGESFGLAVGDIDKDGFKELAVSGDKCVYLFNLSNIDIDNSGNWTIADAKYKTPNVQSNMYAIEIADVDNDGEIELICAGGTGTSGKLFIYEWNGSGLEQILEPFVDDCEITSIVVDDINNDLANELIFSDSLGFLYVCSCTQDGIELIWGMNSVFSEPFGLNFSDIDNDLVNDLVVGTGSGYIEVLNMYVETLGFEQITYFSDDYGTDMFGVKVIDIDLDGNVEFIIGSGSKKVLIIEPDVSTGGLSLEWEIQLIASSCFAIDVSDLNGDGINEIIVGDSDGYMYIWRYAPGTGEGTPP